MAGPKKKPRQAAVIVHGMGEQRPLEPASRFIGVAIPPKPDHVGSEPSFLPQPDSVASAYESRRFQVPPHSENGTEKRARTEFFEYHWSHRARVLNQACVLE